MHQYCNYEVKNSSKIYFYNTGNGLSNKIWAQKDELKLNFKNNQGKVFGPIFQVAIGWIK